MLLLQYLWERFQLTEAMVAQNYGGFAQGSTEEGSYVPKGSSFCLQITYLMMRGLLLQLVV